MFSRQRFRRNEPEPFLKGSTRTRWLPLGLHLAPLLAIIMISIALIAAIQYLVLLNDKHDGIIFAPSIAALPISTTFGYQYLPTVTAVIYGFMWSWVDLDAKRLEPFYQLSLPQGASAANSLLLQYPFDFVASVPLKAVRCGHWAVAAASLAAVTVFWGFTPTQAGIFATTVITKNIPTDFSRSESYLPITAQGLNSSDTYSWSVYNIAWSNESLPAFMTKEYALAPFDLETNPSDLETNETWQAPTQLYSLDLNCEAAIAKSGLLSSSNGCNYMQPMASTDPGVFRSNYIGYHYTYGVDYYLETDDCSSEANRTSLIVWQSSTTNSSSTDGSQVTALYCNATYYQQHVLATVQAPTQSIIGFNALGPKTPLPVDMFNSTSFEMSLSGGRTIVNDSSGSPTAFQEWPNSRAHLQGMKLDLTDIPVLTTLAISASQHPASDYLEPKLLRDSYQAAYRLLFARQMVDILKARNRSNVTVAGSRNYETQAVVVVAGFAYAAEALLGLIIILSISILLLRRRPLALTSDPASIAAQMSLIAGSDIILGRFSSLDQASEGSLRDAVSKETFRLAITSDGNGCTLESVSDPQQIPSICDRSSSSALAVRPSVFRTVIGLAFIAVQVALFVLLLVLYVNVGELNGLPLPSSNRVVLQLLENYVPTVIATIFEPVWVVLNRQLCTLQPFEELRKGNTRASKTISLDYAARPPQLAIVKALSARHTVLAFVCVAAVLANVLAIAFSGLFFEDIVGIPYETRLTTFPTPKLNASRMLEPIDQWGHIRAITDQFYIATSNNTADTPLPAWTSCDSVFVPFRDSSQSNSSGTLRGPTRYFQPDLRCAPLQADAYAMAISTNQTTLNITAQDNFLGSSLCATNLTLALYATSNGTSSVEIMSMPICEDYILSGWIRADLQLSGTFLYAGTVRTGNEVAQELSHTFVVCRPTLLTGLADVGVQSSGVIEQIYSKSLVSNDTTGYLEQNPSLFFNYTHQTLAYSDNPELAKWIWHLWHNDSSPVDPYNYIMAADGNDTSFLDPRQPAPTAAKIIPMYTAAYTKLIAIMWGSNMNIMLVATTEEGTSLGTVQRSETRIFMSKPMFIISEVILLFYIAVTVMVYFRRPWRILPRMPTTLASNIAFFAASHAVNDLHGTSDMATEERDVHLQKLDHRYGYGSFIGTDRKPRIGIERAPFVTALSNGRGADVLSSNSGLSFEFFGGLRKRTKDF